MMQSYKTCSTNPWTSNNNETKTLWVQWESSLMPTVIIEVGAIQSCFETHFWKKP